MLAMDAAQAENELFAMLISAVNLGSHGQKHDIENTLKKLTRRTKKGNGVVGQAPENASGKTASEMIHAFESGELFK